VNFDPDRPLNRIAKRTVAEQKPALGHEYFPHIHATGTLPSSHFFVLASQTCDVIKHEAQEPTVVVLGAFETDNPKVLAEAEGNSPRYFLLDSGNSLVVDARKLALIEKPLLAKMERLSPDLPEEARQRFARWIGRRFNRPALPDLVVELIAGPIVDKMFELRVEKDPNGEVLDAVSEVRIADLQGEPPYEVRLLFVMDDMETSAGTRLALARLVVDMQGWLSGNGRIVAWDAASLYEISAGDYFNTVPLYAEHLTYQGAVKEGAAPPQFGYEDLP